MSLKSNFRKYQFLSALPVSWLKFVSNFFNTLTLDGLTFTPTQSGKGCEIKTVGYTGIQWVLYADRYVGWTKTVTWNQYRLNIVNGLVVDAYNYDSCNWFYDTGGTSFDQTFNIGGGVRLTLRVNGNGSTVRLRVDTGVGGSLLDWSGATNFHSETLDLAAGADTIRFRVDPAGATDWDLQTYYEETP